MNRSGKTALTAVILIMTSGLAHATPAYKGMSYTAFGAEVLSTPASDQSLYNMSLIGTDTVALNVWWFQDTTTSIGIAEDQTLFSASMSSIEHAIDHIHSLGMNVLLKPNLDVKTGEWRAHIDPADPEGWFTEYGNFIGTFADLAEQKGVAMLSVGTEMNTLEQSQHDTRWRDLIGDVRSRYSGDVTYAANHGAIGGNIGGYTNVGWWDALDYIGIDAYFSLTHQLDPTPAQLQTAWTGLADSIESWRSSAGLTQQVLFTEVGYRSLDGANTEPWGGDVTTDADPQEQADAYEALMTTMWSRSWFDGVFWWSWETEPHAGISQPTGFTPQDKPASQVLANFYGGAVPPPPGPPSGLIASFEDGTDGFAATAFGLPGTTIQTSTTGATLGDQSLAVTSPDSGFNWAIQRHVTGIDGEVHDVFLDAADRPDDFLLEFDITVDPADLPPGSPSIVFSIAINSDSAVGGGWSDQHGVATYNSGILETIHVEIPMNAFALGVGSQWYQLILGLSGNWTAGMPGTFYLDNIRLTDTTLIPGDLDGDGFVGITDLNIVLGNWNLNVPPHDPRADPTGDGFIGIEDLNVVLGNWNAGTPPGDGAVIPEPASIVLLIGGAGALLRRSGDGTGMNVGTRG